MTIKADNPSRPYIAGVELNGKPVDRNWLTYDEILGGGELSFKLSAKPVEERENLPAPYSLTTEPFACPPAIQGDLVLFEDDAVGLPSYQFIQDELEYGRTYHTIMDTYERLALGDLRLNATIVAWLAACAADDPGRIPNNPAIDLNQLQQRAF